MAVASVAVDIPAREFSAPFDYDVPDELADRVGIGCAVLVEFGRRRAVGHVVGFADSSAVDGLKPILAVLTPPRFDAVAASLASWIASEYVAPLSDAVRLFLPPGTVPRAVKGPEGWLLRGPAVASVDDRVVELVAESTHAPASGARRQRAVLDALAAGPLTAADLTRTLGPVAQAIRRLEDLGAVRVTTRRRFREPSGALRPAPRHEKLSDGQRAALDAIAVARPGETVLLYGVTGSGKTEVYLRAIELEVRRGRSAIVLVPEISLTPQTVGRFRTRFGSDVAVLHSRLSAGERLDEWDRVAGGHARVVVGARSALFAPVRDLGLVVIDEEHVSSYKHASAPRYHARDVAMRLAAARGARLVLGSATPSLETLHAAGSGSITRVCLADRVGGGALPQIVIADMGKEFLNGNRSIFSDVLAGALRSVEAKGEKAVLLLNRRGFASFVLCRECGHVPGCSRCSTSLTLHESGPLLACHHCGVRRPVPVACPLCRSPYLRRFGAGTQRVVAEVEALVPGLPVVRMDADTTGGSRGHERRLAEFEQTASGVLVGTQMVAKGLDYPDITLVGVVNADTSLHLPDFRAGERTYQMLEQVAGRAGRGARPGTVIIQTYWPDHPALVAVATHHPSHLYDSLTEERAHLRFPPFGRLVNMLITSTSETEVRKLSSEVAERLRELSPQEWEVLGPAPAPLARVKKRHRWHVLVKAPPGVEVATVVRQAVQSVRRAADGTIAVDVDPLDLM